MSYEELRIRNGDFAWGNDSISFDVPEWHLEGSAFVAAYGPEVGALGTHQGLYVLSNLSMWQDLGRLPMQAQETDGNWSTQLFGLRFFRRTDDAVASFKFRATRFFIGHPGSCAN